eukprot:4038196-Ditylum_brightwellii.AAC.1
MSLGTWIIGTSSLLMLKTHSMSSIAKKYRGMSITTGRWVASMPSKCILSLESIGAEGQQIDGPEQGGHHTGQPNCNVLICPEFPPDSGASQTTATDQAFLTKKKITLLVKQGGVGILLPIREALLNQATSLASTAGYLPHLSAPTNSTRPM